MSMEDKVIPRDIPVIDSSEPTSTRLIMTLGVSGLISGLILVFSYVLTLPVIEKNKEEALQEAIYHVLPGCKKYEVLFLKNDQLVKADENGSGGDHQSVKRIFLGFDDKGSVLGFAIPANESGFQDIISLIYGYEAHAKIIVGFEVLDSKETPGLGDKIIKDQNFLANFKALAVEPVIEVAKHGSKTKSNQVETITGATISSKAVIRALQNSLNDWRPAIEHYMQKRQLTYSHSS